MSGEDTLCLHAERIRELELKLDSITQVVNNQSKKITELENRLNNAEGNIITLMQNDKKPQE